MKHCCLAVDLGTLRGRPGAVSVRYPELPMMRRATYDFMTPASSVGRVESVPWQGCSSVISTSASALHALRPGDVVLWGPRAHRCRHRLRNETLHDPLIGI